MINQALKTLRIYYELKQKEIAQKLGVSPSHVSEMENGKVYPSIQILEKYSIFFKIPISNIFLIAEGKINISAVTQNIINLKRREK